MFPSAQIVHINSNNAFYAANWAAVAQHAAKGISRGQHTYSCLQLSFNLWILRHLDDDNWQVGGVADLLGCLSCLPEASQFVAGKALVLFVYNLSKVGHS